MLEEDAQLRDRMRYQFKAAVTLGLNAREFIRRHGLERVGFLTLTLSEHLDWRLGWEWKEAQRRFHSLLAGYLHRRFPQRICVLEPQKHNGWRIHWHLLVGVEHDIRTGFDFEAVKRRDYKSASPALRTLWEELRETLLRYGFGRSELLPLKREGQAVSDYLAKYLSKEGWRCALDQGFKARRVRYSRGVTVATMRWSWNTEGGRKWRTALRHVAKAVGCANLDEFGHWAQGTFGSRWAYHLRDTICALGELLAGGHPVAVFSRKAAEYTVRDASDVAALPEHLRAVVQSVLGFLGVQAQS